MHTDQTYRAFLLKMGDPASDAAIEEEILDGSIDPTYLLQLEDELIDDSLFGRFSAEESLHFTRDFLCTPARKSKLTFAAAMKHYADRHTAPLPRVSVWDYGKRFVAVPWSLPLTGALTGALACALLAAGWMLGRNLILHRELAPSSQQNVQQPRLITPPPQQAAPQQGPGGELTKLAMIRLSGGLQRGGITIPSYPIPNTAREVALVFDPPFNPAHEELFDQRDLSIWKRELSASDAPPRIRTIILPARLFPSGRYRLRVEAKPELGTRLDYQFSVGKQ